jgi:hypothetical protein
LLPSNELKEFTMNLLWLLVILLLIFAVLGVPTVGVWRHSYGYAPSGVVLVIVIILVVLLLTGRF